MLQQLLNQIEHQPKDLREQSSACTVCIRCESAIGVEVLALSFITASLLQLLWCFIVERLEQLVLSVRCFPSYCL